MFSEVSILTVPLKKAKERHVIGFLHVPLSSRTEKTEMGFILPGRRKVRADFFWKQEEGLAFLPKILGSKEISQDRAYQREPSPKYGGRARARLMLNSKRPMHMSRSR